MIKIAYNACFGGFGLSKAARTMFGKRKGWTVAETANFRNWDLFNHRADPDLIAVIEELGDEANGRHARLAIQHLDPGVHYQIEEYDGRESFLIRDEIVWTVAGEETKL